MIFFAVGQEKFESWSPITGEMFGKRDVSLSLSLSLSIVVTIADPFL